MNNYGTKKAEKSNPKPIKKYGSKPAKDRKKKSTRGKMMG